MNRKIEELPTWKEVDEKEERGEELTPLENFIYDNEPMIGDKRFREQLLALLNLDE